MVGPAGAPVGYPAISRRGVTPWRQRRRPSVVGGPPCARRCDAAAAGERPVPEPLVTHPSPPTWKRHASDCTPRLAPAACSRSPPCRSWPRWPPRPPWPTPTNRGPDAAHHHPPRRASARVRAGERCAPQHLAGGRRRCHHHPAGHPSRPPTRRSAGSDRAGCRRGPARSSRQNRPDPVVPPRPVAADPRRQPEPHQRCTRVRRLQPAGRDAAGQLRHRDQRLRADRLQRVQAAQWKRWTACPSTSTHPWATGPARAALGCTWRGRAARCSMAPARSSTCGVRHFYRIVDGRKVYDGTSDIGRINATVFHPAPDAPGRPQGRP